jgi:hypothetical protein
VLALAACEPVWPVKVADLNNADAAASWQVADFTANGSTYSAGQLTDLVFGLAATTDDRATAQAALVELAPLTGAYADPGGVANAGAAGKVMLAVQSLRGDPTSFGGLNLETLIRGTLAGSGANAGQFGTSYPFTQALAMLALARTSSGIPASSATWLATQQCPDGGFGYGDCSYEDVDSTATAAQALAAAGGQQAALTSAVNFILANQNGDRGFGTGGASNANSTGLAVQALRKVGDTTQANNGAAYIAGIQYTSSAGTKAGAIPWESGNDGFSLQSSSSQGVLAFGAGPLDELTFAKIVGSPCSGTSGVTEVVDLTRFDNTIRVACATGAQASGWTALTNAGFKLTSVPGFEGQSVCTINTYPTDGYPDCWNTGFWGYFTNTTNTGTWSYASSGPAGRVPPLGSVEGWSYNPDWSAYHGAPPGIPAPTH